MLKNTPAGYKKEYPWLKEVDSLALANVPVLSFFQPEQRKRDKLLWKKTLKGIVTNPIIIGIAAGLFWSALRIPMPYVIEKTVSNIGAVATPLGLMALGASFDVQKALGKIKPVIAACMLKLVGFTAVFQIAF